MPTNRTNPKSGDNSATPARQRQSQLERFKAVARELEADDDPKAFEKRVAEIAKAKGPSKK